MYIWVIFFIVSFINSRIFVYIDEKLAKKL